MRYLTLGEIVELHRRILQAGGAHRASGILTRSTLPSLNPKPRSVAPISIRRWSRRPRRCASRWFRTHPFVDGDKRVGHAAMETFLVLNGAEIGAAVDEQEHLMLDLAAGRIDRTHLTDWLRHHLRPLT